jgi:TPR repeat protein
LFLKGTPKDLQKAVDLYEKVINVGVLQALNSLGYILSEEKEYPKRNVKRATKIYKRAINEINDMRSMYNLGNILMSGVKTEGIDRNINKALELYKKASLFGNSQSMVSLGVFYQDGCEEEGIKRDYQLAIKYYEDAIELSLKKFYFYYFIYFNYFNYLENSVAMFNLGFSLFFIFFFRFFIYSNKRYVYHEGIGVTKSLKKAKELYEKSMEYKDRGKYFKFILLNISKTKLKKK